MNKAIVPAINNALLMILYFRLREDKPHKIKIIAISINITPKPIFKIFSPPGIKKYVFIFNYHNQVLGR